MTNNQKYKIHKKTSLLGIVVSTVMLSSLFLLGGCSSEESVTATSINNMSNHASDSAEGTSSYVQEILSSSANNQSVMISSIAQNISSSQIEETTSSSFFLTTFSSSFIKSSSSSSVKSSSSKSNLPKISGSYLIDNRDENKYKLVTIGEQTWFAENLKYKSDSSWCYNNSLDSCKKYGRLYQWHSAMNLSKEYAEKIYNSSMDLGKKDRGLCPVGWHLPNLNDWDMLLNNIDSLNAFQGLLLKSTDFWKELMNGYDTYSFNAYPAGYYNQGQFGDIGYTTTFWSSIEDFGNKQSATSIRMSSKDNKVSRINLAKKRGASVRCIADSTIDGVRKKIL